MSSSFHNHFKKQIGYVVILLATVPEANQMALNVVILLATVPEANQVAPNVIILR
jgi:hypothetical protein